MEDLDTIVLGDQEFPLSRFSEHVQQMANAISTWENELAKQKEKLQKRALKIFKLESALRNAHDEITKQIKKELGS